MSIKANRGHILIVHDLKSSYQLTDRPTCDLNETHTRIMNERHHEVNELYVYLTLRHTGTVQYCANCAKCISS